MNVSRVPSISTAMHRIPSASQLSDSGEEIELKSLKRSVSGLQLVDLADAEQLSGPWCWDPSKLRGHRFDTSGWHAVVTCLDPNSNEFWNCLTEILPLCHLCLIALEIAGAVDLGHDVSGGSNELRRAVIGTLLGSVVQHVCSLAAHVGRSVSPRLSHSIWYVDFAGIFINNVWNVAPLVLLMAPQLARTVPALEWLMLGWSLGCSSLLLWYGLRRAATYRPKTEGRDGGRDTGENVSILNFITEVAGGPRRGLLAVLALVLPNTLLSLLAGRLVDHRAPLPILGFCTAFCVKVSNVPNRWARPGYFDFSPLHSHALWHLGVWASQSIYVQMYLSALGAAAP